MTPAGTSFRNARDFLIRHRTDYATAYADFRWPEVSAFNWALDHFEPLARGNAHTALWIVDEGGDELRYSFDEIQVGSNRAANFLAANGVRRGDRILTMLPNRVELWELMLGAMKIGAVVCPTTMLLSEADLADRISRSEARAVVVDASVAERVPAVGESTLRVVVGGSRPGWRGFADAAAQPASFAPDGTTQAEDPCVIYFTSGTTSRPKMVVHSHRSYPIGHLSTLYWLGLQEADVHLNISSPGWAKHAWSCFFAPWTVGATVLVYNQRRFDAKATLRTIARCGVTTMCAPPTAWRALILEDLRAHPVKLRELVSAGEPLNPEVIQRVADAWGLVVREGFGQTESTAMIGNPPGQPVRPGSMGRPLPGYLTELLDEQGAPAEEGELCVDLLAGPGGLLKEYAGDPARTSRALGGRYFGTADRARRDADGFIWYVGRADDVFKSSDYRISPFELESALMEHPCVAEVAVIESPDPKKLFVPKACIVLTPDTPADPDTARSIFQFARKRLAPYQRLRIVEFTELPKTVSGKIRRAELRAIEAERRTKGDRAPAEYFD